MTVILKYHDYRKLEQLMNFLYEINRMTFGFKKTSAIKTYDHRNPYNYEITL